jgi:hypothetical protein
LDELIAHSDILLITRDGDAVLDRAAKLKMYPLVIDLSGRPVRFRKTTAVAVASAASRGSDAQRSRPEIAVPNLPRGGATARSTAQPLAAAQPAAALGRKTREILDQRT